MANRNPEQDLINKFVESIKKTKGVEIVCANCKLQSRADVEFKMQNGEYWVIEAKSRDSSDKYNTVHKLFGELLKETGRTRNEGMLRIGVLMPTEGKDFYIKCFSAIDKIGRAHV